MSKVAWDYIVPVKMPKDLKGCEPGKLDARLLREVSGGKMHHIASYAWEAMMSRAKKGRRCTKANQHSRPLSQL